MASEATTTTTNFAGMDFTSTKLFRKFGKGDFITEVNNWRSVYVLAEPSKGPPSSLSPKDHQPFQRQTARQAHSSMEPKHQYWPSSLPPSIDHPREWHFIKYAMRSYLLHNLMRSVRLLLLFICCCCCVFSLSPECHCPFCSSYPFFPSHS